MKVYHIVKDELEFAVGDFLHPRLYNLDEFKSKKREVEEELEKVRSDCFTKEDIKRKYKHVSEHTLLFECDIIPQEGTDFSERWTFLKSLFYITDDGYNFQYSDVVPNGVNVKQEGDPFDIYLDGALR